MITKELQRWARDMARKVAQIFVKTPITPNMLTLFGLVLNAGVAALLVTDHKVAGGIMLIIAGLFDMLDGALARVTDKTSTFGAFLDSVVDRYSEAIVLLGLLLYYYLRDAPYTITEIVLIYVILVGSMMISYTRARAGALDIHNEVGVLARPERIILLAIGLVFSEPLSFFQIGFLLPVLWILAIGTQLTAIQRVMYVWQVTSGKRENK